MIKQKGETKFAITFPTRHFVVVGVAIAVVNKDIARCPINRQMLLFDACGQLPEITNFRARKRKPR